MDLPECTYQEHKTSTCFCSLVTACFIKVGHDARDVDHGKRWKVTCSVCSMTTGCDSPTNLHFCDKHQLIMLKAKQDIRFFIFKNVLLQPLANNVGLYHMLQFFHMSQSTVQLMCLDGEKHVFRYVCKYL